MWYPPWSRVISARARAQTRFIRAIFSLIHKRGEIRESQRALDMTMCVECNILNNKYYFMSLNIKHWKEKNRNYSFLTFIREPLVRKHTAIIRWSFSVIFLLCLAALDEMCVSNVSIQDVITATFAFIDFSLFVLGVLGNAIVIYVISSDKKLKNKSNYHILSVAVADFLIALPGIPLSVISVSLVNFQLSLQ